MKEIPHFRGTPVHAFRVPLDTYGKWMTFQFNCLNSSVLRAGADHNPLSGSVDCLMVETVYIETASGIFPEAGSTFCADPMADFFTGSGLLHVVEGVTGNEGHILPDRTPAGYVEDLHSPADGEHRFSRGKNPFHEPDLKEIYGNACFTISVFRFFAEDGKHLEFPLERGLPLPPDEPMRKRGDLGMGLHLLFLYENLNPFNKFANFYFVCVAILEVFSSKLFKISVSLLYRLRRGVHSH